MEAGRGIVYHLAHSREFSWAEHCPETVEGLSFPEFLIKYGKFEQEWSGGFTIPADVAQNVLIVGHVGRKVMVLTQLSSPRLVSIYGQFRHIIQFLFPVECCPVTFAGQYSTLKRMLRSPSGLKILPLPFLPIFTRYAGGVTQQLIIITSKLTPPNAGAMRFQSNPLEEV